MLSFWSNVKEELDYNLMSQKELAAKIGISYNTLQSWITKDRLPDAADSVKIANTLGVTVEYLVTGSDTSSSQSENPQVKEIILDIRHLSKSDLGLVHDMIKRMAK